MIGPNNIILSIDTFYNSGYSKKVDEHHISIWTGSNSVLLDTFGVLGGTPPRLRFSKTQAPLFDQKYCYDSGYRGIKNSNGDTIIKAVFEKIKIISEDKYLVFYGGCNGVGIIDTSGHVLLEPIYNSIAEIGSYYKALIDDKHYLFDKDCKPLFLEPLEEADISNDFLLYYKKNGRKYFEIRDNGSYTSLDSNIYNAIVVSKNCYAITYGRGVWEIYKRNGERIFGPNYFHFSSQPSDRFNKGEFNEIFIFSLFKSDSILGNGILNEDGGWILKPCTDVEFYPECKIYAIKDKESFERTIYNYQNQKLVSGIGTINCERFGIYYSTPGHSNIQRPDGKILLNSKGGNLVKFGGDYNSYNIPKILYLKNRDPYFHGIIKIDLE